MNLQNDHQKTITFYLIFGLYFMIYFGVGIIPANIESLLQTLSGTTEFWVSVIISMMLIIGMVSMLFFGYYGDLLSSKLTCKHLFLINNAFWVFSYGLSSLALNYIFLLLSICIGAIGIGAFLPIGFSMISELYPPEERGTKFGLMQFGLILGSGTGSVIGKVIGWRICFGIGSIFGLVLLLGYFLLGITTKTEMLQVEGSIQENDYNYKITVTKLKQVFQYKSIAGILLAVFCSGIALYTLANWGIFYLGLHVGGGAVFLYIISGMGALPGAILGGYLGDKFHHIDKNRGRIPFRIM